MGIILDDNFESSNELYEFVERKKNTFSARLQRMTPEKRKRHLDRIAKRDQKQVGRMKNGFYCDEGCNGKKCHWYLDCSRKDVGNPNIKMKRDEKGNYIYFKK